MSRTPAYFLSVGGPSSIESPDHPAHHRLAEVGREITTRIKPKAIVIFSAHWQDSPNKVMINVAENADIIHDFYGFPPHYYEIKYPNKGSPQVAEQVIDKFVQAGIQVERVKRGLDHGVWVGFRAAFDPEVNPLDCPIVQVSLYNNDDGEIHYQMGRALESLRSEGILIIGAGMAVHNLRDYRATRATGRTMPYAAGFDEKLREAATAEVEDRQAKMTDLLKHRDARAAHPTFEHILPILVVAGAAGADRGERLWTYPEGSLNWAQYRFGEIAVA